ncbi:MAG TPA: EAL domain-containing protein [Azonexus sp.]
MSFLKRSALAARTLFYVLMASLLVFVLATTAGVVHERQRILQAAHDDVQALVERNSAAVAGALWNYDTAGLQALLQGMSRFGAIVRIAVRDDRGPVAEAQQPGAASAADREWAMPVMAPDGSRQIGTLTIGESHAEVHRHIAATVRTLVVAELVKVLCLTVLLFVIVYRLIARHVSQLAAAVTAIRPNDLLAQVELHRKPRKTRDELDTLTDAINSFLGERAEEMHKRSQAEENLRARMAEMEVVLGALSDGVVALDGDCRIRFANTAARNLLGRPGETLEGMALDNLLSVVNERNGKPIDGICPSVLGGTPVQLRGHTLIRTAAGSEFPSRISALPVPGSLDVRMIFVFTDISAEISKERQIEFQAYHDPLTQLGNRSLLARDLAREIDSARHDSQRLAVLCADLDNFKNINDALGHTIGDLLLKELALRLADTVQPPAWITRHGGDEFIIVIPRLSDESQATEVARAVMRCIGEAFDIEGHQLRVTSSVGISIYPDHGLSIGELLSNADMAMYEAKRDGRNIFRFYENDLLYRSSERLAMENGLRVALAGNELFLVFQPKVAIASGEIHSVEALLRWRTGSGELISPATFIPVAEASGLIIDIGDWVLRQSLQAARRWRAELGFPVAIAVNVSSLQFRSERLLATLDELAASEPDLASLLELELTESALAGDIRDVTNKLQRIHALGLKVALDDFGTGYSSLAYLKNIPIDILKVDQAFIRELHINTQDMAIVGSIIQLGKSLGFAIVAEGVEEERHVAILAGMGCDYAQGYWFARPQGEVEVLARIVQNRAALPG